MNRWSGEGGYRNHVLYRMCIAQPHHCNASVVSGKVQLIGRAYSAAPSRGVKIDSFDEGIADAIVTRGSELDLAIATAQESGRISINTVERSVGAHRLLNEIIMDFIRNSLGGEAGRGLGHRDSFCSKYLHFHAPMAFPIYDSIVTKTLRQRLEEKRYSLITRRGGPTGVYANFCRKLIAYADENHDPDAWTPRSVDGELWPYDVISTLKKE